jgi:Kelch motif/Bacterial Ig-like domain (group 2)
MRRGTILALFAVALAVSGCGGPGSGPNDGKQANITVIVTPATVSVYGGKTVQFQAQVSGQQSQAVTWSIHQGVGTIDSTGLYTAPFDSSPAAFQVVATTQGTPTASGFASVAVLAAQVTITPATATLSPGGTQTFTAAANGLDIANVTWTVQEESGGSITAAGSYDAPDTAGFYHVVATSVESATLSTTAVIAVTSSSGRFTPTGDMTNGNSSRTATLLSDGRVLVAGGVTRAGPICRSGMTAAELYDPSSGSFAATGSMGLARYSHAAVLLAGGQVLITGGLGTANDCEDLGGPFAQDGAEIYDPSTASFKTTGSMAKPRELHTATLLLNGKVLIAGGSNEAGDLWPAAEIYDPGSGAFTSTPNMVLPRVEHTATSLSNGKVLIAGGFSMGRSPMAAAELFDPASGNFTPTGSMLTPRYGHTATVLGDGRILIAGGYTDVKDAGGNFQASSSAEIYNPATGSFSATGAMIEARAGHSATLLHDGTVLVAGDDATAEIYDPSTGLFSTTGAMETEHAGHSATLLPNGMVLVAGGAAAPNKEAAELYQPKKSVAQE